MEHLEYSFIRTEADNKITLFIKSDTSWLEQDLDIGLTDNEELIIKFPNGTEIKSLPVKPILYEHLALSNTLAVFCDQNMNFMAEVMLSPMKPNYNPFEDKRKVKP